MKAVLFLLPLGAIAPEMSFVSTPELATVCLELLILNLSLATHFITPVKCSVSKYGSYWGLH
jgi:hypothetical protein